MLWLSVCSCVRSALPTHSSLERHTCTHGASNRDWEDKKTNKGLSCSSCEVYRANNYVCLLCMYAVLPDIMLMCFDRLRCEFFILLRGNFFLTLAQNSWCWPVLLHNLLTHIASLFDLCWVLNREPAQVVPVFDDSRLHLVWSNCERAIRPEVTLCGWRDLLIHLDLLTCFAPAARPHCSTDAQKVSVTIAPVFIHARTACYHSCNT